MTRCPCGAFIEPAIRPDGTIIVLERTDRSCYNVLALRDGTAYPYTDQWPEGGPEYIEHICGLKPCE